MRRIVLIALVVALAGCTPDNSQLKARMHYWEQTLAQEIAPGTDRDTILRWASSRHIVLAGLEREHKLYGTLEVIPDRGLFCSQWKIMLDVTLDTTGRWKQIRVNHVEMCL